MQKYISTFAKYIWDLCNVHVKEVIDLSRALIAQIQLLCALIELVHVYGTSNWHILNWLESSSIN